MNEMAIYREFRPNTFSAIVGQEDTIETIRNMTRAGESKQAYLLVGVRGTGKTTTARVLTKAVNCLNPIDGEPCNECTICRAIDNGTTLDVVEIDGASNNSVNNAREIKESVNYAPTQCKYKVYIIDEVHMLSTGAFNALLKTLEEPPAHVKFILCTTELHKVPATIRSRCLILTFKRISNNIITQTLADVCKKKGREAEPNALKLIATNSDGALRDALSMLEQALYLSKDVITEEVVARMIGCSNNKHIIELCESILNMNIRQAIKVFNILVNAGKDTIHIVNELIQCIRDCMVLKATEGALELDNTEEYKHAIIQLANSTSLENILHVFSELSNGFSRLKGNPIAAENAIAMLCIPRKSKSEDLDNIATRVYNLENRTSQYNYRPQITKDADDVPGDPLGKEEVKITEDDTAPWEDTPEGEKNEELDTKVREVLKDLNIHTDQEVTEKIKDIIACKKGSSEMTDALKPYIENMGILIKATNRLINLQDPNYNEPVKIQHKAEGENENQEITTEEYIKKLIKSDVVFAALLNINKYEVADSAVIVTVSLPFYSILDRLYRNKLKQSGIILDIKVVDNSKNS